MAGAAIAAVSGLLMGAGLKPELDVQHGARAPQILIPHAGPRSLPVTAQPTLASYGGNVPSYVVGTDSLAPPEPQIVEASIDESDPIDNPVVVYEAPGPRVDQARWVEPPRPPSSYPSVDGGVAYPSDMADVHRIGARIETRPRDVAQAPVPEDAPRLPRIEPAA